MFLGERASDVREIAIIDPTDAVTIHHADATYGVVTVVANAWGCSRNGGNKFSSQTL